jgi:hypothetical protein
MTEADRWFERCLLERDCDPGEHEPDLSEQGLTKSPEFIPTNAVGQQAAFEVKAFSQNSKLGEQFARQKSGVFDGRRLIVPIRNQLGEAAAQLKGVAGKMPAVVVLANPHGGHVDMTVDGVLQAMYGDGRYVIPIDRESGSGGPARYELGRDGKLTNDHRYLSAVVILRRRELRDDAQRAVMDEVESRPDWESLSAAEKLGALHDAVAANEHDFPDGEYFHVDVIDTISAMTDGPALALPDDWFKGPLDTRWRFDGADGVAQVSGPAKPLRL